MQIYYSSRRQHHHTEHLVKDGQPYLIEAVPERVETVRQAAIDAGLGLVSEPQNHR